MADEDDKSATYGLVVAFPDPSPSFVHGFEAGGLWEKLKNGETAEIQATTHVENREVIARMADAEGWEIEVKPTEVEGWDFTKLEKKRPAREKPNPHGLRVVS